MLRGQHRERPDLSDRGHRSQDRGHRLILTEHNLHFDVQEFAQFYAVLQSSLPGCFLVGDFVQGSAADVGRRKPKPFANGSTNSLSDGKV
jgi:hypothetical protein